MKIIKGLKKEMNRLFKGKNPRKPRKKQTVEEKGLNSLRPESGNRIIKENTHRRNS